MSPMSCAAPLPPPVGNRISHVCFLCSCPRGWPAASPPSQKPAPSRNKAAGQWEPLQLGAARLGSFLEGSGQERWHIPSSLRAFSSLLLFLFDGPRTYIWFTLVLKKTISWPEDSSFQEGSPMMCGSRQLPGGPVCGQSALPSPGSRPL